MFKVVKVRGASMAPLYLPGEYCFCKKIKPQNLSVGEVVVCDLPGIGKVIKRIHSLDPTTRSLTLEGMNSESISSEKMGLVAYEQVLWKVLWPRRRLKKS